MPRSITLKNAHQETRLFQHRIETAGIIIFLLFFILFCRLTYIQIFRHQFYSTLARQNQVSTVPIAPLRGLIYDRNGILLANNVPAFQLVLTPEHIPNLAEALSALQKILPITEDHIHDFELRRRLSRPLEAIPLKMQLSEEEVAIFSLNRYAFPGMDIRAIPIRHYTKGPAFAHALGYVGRLSENDLKQVEASTYAGATSIGKTGIEKIYEEDLRGTVGYQLVETDARGRQIKVLSEHPAIAGQNMTLTLDANLQEKAYEWFEGQKGALVAIEPDTGEVLAILSAPGFDPNLFVTGIDRVTYAALNQNPSMPLFNRTLQGQYPPASTIKPFVALIGLEHEVVTTETTISDPGWYQLGGAGRRYRDWRPHGHGQVNLQKAISQSCDTYYYRMAHQLGIERLSESLLNFGFGALTAIDLTQERSGLVPTRGWKQKTYQVDWYPGETLSLGIGQGYMLATPLQMAHLTAFLANKGTMYQPHLLKQKGNEPLYEAPLDREIILNNEAHWNIVIEAMQDVVDHPQGTAHYLKKNTPYSIAGKTGTAQVFGLKQNEKYKVEQVAHHLRDHSLFIAFAPVDHPKIAIAVIIENSKGAPLLAQKVIHEYLSNLPAEDKQEETSDETAS